MSWRQRLELAHRNAQVFLSPKAKLERRPGASAEELVRATVEARWNGRFFSASDQRPDRFSLRDFGLAVRGLIHIDQSERARQSLRWALKAFAALGLLAPGLDSDGRPLYEACRAPDSLPFLLHAIDQLELVEEVDRAFLQEQARRYDRAFIDPDARQLVRARMFGGFKDRVHFSGACTHVVMIGWCSALLDKLAIAPNPLADLAIAEELREWFWTGDFFRNDLLSQPPICSGDANLWPYWCGLIDDEASLKASIEAARDRGLDQPLPLKYHAEPMPDRELQPYRFFLPNSQGDAIWSSLGLPWIELVARVDRPRARAYLEAYRRRIIEHGAFIETFDPAGLEAHKGRFGFVADQGPIWAVDFIRLADEVAAPEGEESLHAGSD